MDIVSQIALGASIGQISLGQKIGYKAALYGGALAILPDLDVLIPANTGIDKLILHRSWSHSLFFLTLLTPLLSFLIIKLRKDTKVSSLHWIITVWLCLITHPLLDAFTVYGTQLLWPFFDMSVVWGSLFIIDPLFTIPLLIGIGISLRKKYQHKIRFINTIALCVSCLYISWSIVAQHIIYTKVRDNFQKKNIHIENMLVSSSPFNTLLWRYIAVDKNNYYEGFYSLVDNNTEIKYTSYPHQKHLLNNLTDLYHVERLQWFTHGIYKVEWKSKIYNPHKDQIIQNPSLIVTDLRMGFSENYVFRFSIAEKNDDTTEIIKNYRLKREFNTKLIKKIFLRIFDSNISFK